MYFLIVGMKIDRFNETLQHSTFQRQALNNIVGKLHVENPTANDLKNEKIIVNNNANEIGRAIKNCKDIKVLKKIFTELYNLGKNLNFDLKHLDESIKNIDKLDVIKLKDGVEKTISSDNLAMDLILKFFQNQDEKNLNTMLQGVATVGFELADKSKDDSILQFKDLYMKQLLKDANPESSQQKSNTLKFNEINTRTRDGKSPKIEDYEVLQNTIQYLLWYIGYNNSFDNAIELKEKTGATDFLLNINKQMNGRGNVISEQELNEAVKSFPLKRYKPDLNKSPEGYLKSFTVVLGNANKYISSVNDKNKKQSQDKKHVAPKKNHTDIDEYKTKISKIISDATNSNNDKKRIQNTFDRKEKEMNEVSNDDEALHTIIEAEKQPDKTKPGYGLKYDNTEKNLRDINELQRKINIDNQKIDKYWDRENKNIIKQQSEVFNDLVNIRDKLGENNLSPKVLNNMDRTIHKMTIENRNMHHAQEPLYQQYKKSPYNEVENAISRYQKYPFHPNATFLGMDNIDYRSTNNNPSHTPRSMSKTPHTIDDITPQIQGMINRCYVIEQGGNVSLSEDIEGKFNDLMNLCKHKIQIKKLFGYESINVDIDKNKLLDVMKIIDNMLSSSNNMDIIRNNPVSMNILKYVDNIDNIYDNIPLKTIAQSIHKSLKDKISQSQNR